MGLCDDESYTFWMPRCSSKGKDYTHSWNQYRGSIGGEETIECGILCLDGVRHLSFWIGV